MDWLSPIAAGVIIQGLTGRAARSHARHMVAYGTPVAAGVVPGRAHQDVDGIPIFDTVRAAADATGALTTIAYLPAEAAGDGLLEAAAAGIRLAVSVTEGIETHDVLPALTLARMTGMCVVGPNSPGLLVPGRFSLGFLPTHVSRPGHCAVLARSGTLSYEVVWQLTEAGIGQSLWVVVGGDRVKGSSFSDIIPLLAADESTKALVLVGEIGGSDEEDAAALLGGTAIPTVALIAGRHAPPERPMGHAGALIADGSGGYSAKVEALIEAGVKVVNRPSEIPAALERIAPLSRG